MKAHFRLISQRPLPATVAPVETTESAFPALVAGILPALRPTDPSVLFRQIADSVLGRPRARAPLSVVCVCMAQGHEIIAATWLVGWAHPRRSETIPLRGLEARRR